MMKINLPVRTAKVIQMVLAIPTQLGDGIHATNRWSIEIFRVPAKAFLAQRISLINGNETFFDATGADLREVPKVIDSKSRIGSMV